MIEITNRGKGPVQLLVRSKVKSDSFTTLVVPGRGKGKNVVVIPDEWETEYIARAEDVYKLISTKRITNK